MTWLGKERQDRWRNFQKVHIGFAHQWSWSAHSRRQSEYRNLIFVKGWRGRRLCRTSFGVSLWNAWEDEEMTRFRIRCCICEWERSLTWFLLTEGYLTLTTLLRTTLLDGGVVVVVVVVVFIGETRKAKASPGSRAYSHTPLGEFLAPNITLRLILRPRATSEC